MRVVQLEELTRGLPLTPAVHRATDGELRHTVRQDDDRTLFTPNSAP